jgi:hypothetical protein
VHVEYFKPLTISLSVVFTALLFTQILSFDTRAQTSGANHFIVNYTVAGGFAPTFKSIVINSSNNRILEFKGYPKHIDVERKLIINESDFLEKTILKNNFFQTKLQDYSPCCDLKYFYLTIIFNNTKNSVNWISGSTVPENILKIVGTIENLTSFKK